MAKCKMCGCDTADGFSFCDNCWNSLRHEPMVHLRLVASDKDEQGVVMWEHNNIGGPPYDANAEAIGIWGKYGNPPALEFWVGLCKPIDAIHDMMTQYMATVSQRNREFAGSVMAARPKQEKKSKPEPMSEFDSLRAKLRGG